MIRLSIRRDMVRMLQSMGYRVIEAGDGVEARQLLRQHDFAMVFSDLEMPRMDGFELLQEIRRDRRTTDLPVVVASSRNESTCRSRALELELRNTWSNLSPSPGYKMSTTDPSTVIQYNDTPL